MALGIFIANLPDFGRALRVGVPLESGLERIRIGA
jgi:hypothetical protein